MEASMAQGKKKRKWHTASYLQKSIFIATTIMKENMIP